MDLRARSGYPLHSLSTSKISVDLNLKICVRAENPLDLKIFHIIVIDHNFWNRRRSGQNPLQISTQIFVNFANISPISSGSVGHFWQKHDLRHLVFRRFQFHFCRCYAGAIGWVWIFRVRLFYWYANRSINVILTHCNTSIRESMHISTSVMYFLTLTLCILLFFNDYIS